MRTNKEHYQKYKNYQKKYREENKEEYKQYMKEYYQNNKEKMREQGKNYYTENSDKIKKHVKEYYWEHREERLKYHKEWRRTENWKKSKRKEYAKRKKFGSNELYDNPFCSDVLVDWHHVDNENIVAIPRDIHRQFLGSFHRENLKYIVLQIYPDYIKHTVGYD